MTEQNKNVEKTAGRDGQVNDIVTRRPKTPAYNEDGAPFFCYCIECGRACYADEYTEQLDCLGICDDCYLATDDEY